MDTGGYKVLIYHTHGSEAFADSRPGEVDDTVIGLGNRLAEILTDTYGIPVYHDTTAYDMMTGVLDRNASYDYSREGVSQISIHICNQMCVIRHTIPVEIYDDLYLRIVLKYLGMVCRMTHIWLQMWMESPQHRSCC